MKPMSLDARNLRKYHSEVRKFKEWCYNHDDIDWFTFDTANPDCICVLSRNEYDLHEYRRNIEEDSESYFLSEEDYDTWCDEEVY